MMQEFITAFMTKINLSCTAYYDEAPADATFPYAVVSITTTPLDYGDQMNVTVTHWHTEAPGNAVALEAQCDTVRTALDGVSLNVSASFNSYVRYDSQRPVADPIPDYIVRQQDFLARVFHI